MRAGLPADLDVLARALLAVDQRARTCRADEIFRLAHLADRSREANLPRAGNGTVAAAAMLFDLAPLPKHCDEAYCDALGIALERLSIWRLTNRLR
jgi:hypothetical protein